MERRLFTFLVASTAFLLFYMSLRTMFAPAARPPAANQANEAAALLADDPDEVEPVANAPAENVENGEAVATERPARPQWLTLGSMDAESGYYILATFNSQGAGIERIELTERTDQGLFRYRRVDVRHGYLGYLAGQMSEGADGVLVNVVGPGTPAQLAGVEVGDVIVSLAGKPVATREDLELVLLESKPGDRVSIEIVRGPSATPQTLQATLTEHPLDLVRLASDGGADQITGNLSRLSCLMTLSQINRKAIPPHRRSIAGSVDPMELNWTVEQPRVETGESARFQLELSNSEMQPLGGQAVRLGRTYTLQPNSYLIDMAVQVDNLSDQPQDLAYRLEGANGITLEGWWYSNRISPNMWGGAAARDIVYNTTASKHQLLSGYDLLKQARNQSEDPNTTILAGEGSKGERELKYVGVDAQYFTVAYIPPEGSDAFTTFRRASAGVVADPQQIRRHQEQAVNVTYYLDSVIASVPVGQSMRQELRMFAGPKQPELLAEFGLSGCIYYGWFARFAKILAQLLHLLSGIGNYAVAIILLTVIVRGCMFPLSRKAAINAQKMQELAPEIKKINEKYKDDMEGKLKAQRELQQRVGFNPLAGCLPMFLQLPIFIGLYRALSVDIELRQAAFSSFTDWASNLAGPDKLLYWGDWLWEYFSGRGTGWLGPYFNILPVIVVVLFLVQQKLFMPPATDEQTAMTQKMMNIMTLMMGLFFFRVPAGLCVYFITSSLWGICERVLVKKTLPTNKHFDAAVLEGTAVRAEKSKSIADRIRSHVAKPEVPVERPNKRRRPAKKKRIDPPNQM